MSKPYERPQAIIANNVALYERLRKSTVPADVMQCIALAQNIREQAEQLVRDSEARRTSLLNVLQPQPVAESKPRLVASGG